MSRKRVLFFVPLPPPVTGAALRNQSLLESSLIRDAFEVKVIPFNFAESVSDIGKFSVGKMGKAMVRFFQLLIAIIRFRPHLVYFNFSLYGFALYRDTVYAGLFKLFNCRLLYHLRTQGVRMQVEQSRFKRTLFRFIFRNTEVVCLSAALSEDIRDVFAGRVHVVSNGIEDVSQQSAAMIKDPAREVRILYLGHLAKFKGILDLLEALKELSIRGVQFRATLAGEEGDLTRETLQALLAGYGIDNQVKIVGFVSGADKSRMLREHDVFVLPTHFEAFPGVVLEAMQFSLPVVATRVGAIPEMVDDEKTGLLYDKGHVNELADRIEQLLRNDERRQALGAAGRKKFESHYTLAQFERNMKEVFDLVIAG